MPEPVRRTGVRLGPRSVAACTALLILCAACADSTDEVEVTRPPGPAPLSAVTITIDHATYSGLPPITPGAVITVVNHDSVRHSVTSKRPGLFDTVVEAGRTATFTAPTEVGSHPFYCRYHAFMSGWLSVRTNAGGLGSRPIR